MNMIFTALYVANLYMEKNTHTARDARTHENTRLSMSVGF
ncbi:MAG: hypothetical protein HMLIMOIP_002156 [Candidatus Nitrosomirales archaeon]|jgi:hypothetical protein